MNHWWTGQEAALIGAIGGSAVGLLGAALGVSMGVLGRQGKGRAFVIGGLTLMACLGIILLGVGLVAVFGGQPYHVYYPCLLGGVLLSILGLALLPGARNVYRQAHARRLEAEELRRAG